MKKYLTTFIISCLSLSAFAQIEAPVKWSYGVKKTGKDQAVIFIKATIEKGWHIYSQTVKDGGPVKTAIKFNPSSDYLVTGQPTAPKPISKFEQAFKMDVEYYENQVIFQQKVSLKNGQATVKGTIEYMACNNKECLPPEDVDFSVDVK